MSKIRQNPGRKTPWQGLILGLVFSVFACLTQQPAWSGELVSDNLSVYQDGRFYGTFSVENRSNGGLSITNGLVLSLPFSDNSDTWVVDESGMGNSGQVYNATWVSNGISGGAYYFNGTNSYITVPDHPSLNPASAITLTAWIYLTAYPTEYPITRSQILSKFYDGNMRDYELFVDSTFQYQFSVDNWHRYQYTTVTLTPGQWWMVTATYDGAYQCAYVNGELNASQGLSGNLDDSNEPLSIGRMTAAGDPYAYFTGYIDEVRIYNRALSASEIRRMYIEDQIATGNEVVFMNGITHLKPLGDVPMGIFTNHP